MANSLFLFSEHGNARAELAELYALQKSDRTPEEKKRIQADMLRCGKEYGFTFKEYMRYGFERKTPEEQHTFISDKEHVRFCERLNAPETHTLLDNKYSTYLFFKPYFRREAMLVQPAAADAFLPFAAAHPSLMIKPNEDWGGAAVTAAYLKDYDSAGAMLEALLRDYPEGFLAEEKLSNAGVLYDVHPSSLNTLRVSTIRLPDGVHVIHPRVRIGCGGSVVDNISVGGFQGQVDTGTGEVITACDAAGGRCDVHPDTGVRITGMKIPDWQEAVAMTKELAAAVDGLHYGGWDIAYTDRGWVLVEGNDLAQFGWQTVEQKGCRAEFERYLEILGL